VKHNPTKNKPQQRRRMKKEIEEEKNFLKMKFFKFSLIFNDHLILWLLEY
jgi:hypothetical protein